MKPLCLFALVLTVATLTACATPHRERRPVVIVGPAPPPAPPRHPAPRPPVPEHHDGPCCEEPRHEEPVCETRVPTPERSDPFPEPYRPQRSDPFPAP